MVQCWWKAMAGNNTWLRTSGRCHRSSSTSTSGEYHFHCIVWGYYSNLNLGGELILFKVFIFWSIFLFYSFDAPESGVVVAKEHSDSIWTRFWLLRNTDVLPPIDGLPVQAPLGLDTTKRVYFWEDQGLFRWRDHGYHMPCTKVKGRTETGSYSFPCSCVVWTDQFITGGEFPVIQAFGSASLLTHMPYVAAAIHFLSWCPASLPLIVCT